MSGDDNPLDNLLSSTRKVARKDDSPSSEQENDALDSLIHATRKRKTGSLPVLSADEDPRKTPGTHKKGGLDPLDLLNLPREQRELINWLSRQKQATLDDLQQALKKSADDIKEILAALKNANYILETEKQGQIHYSVVYRGMLSRAARGLSDDIWSRVDLDHTPQLRKVSFFASLSENTLREASNKIKNFRYKKDDVLLKAGDNLNIGMFFIKSGSVGVIRFSTSTEGEVFEQRIILNEGDIFVEATLLTHEESHIQFTVIALSEVETLFMPEKIFFELIEKYPAIGIDMSRILARRILGAEIQPIDKPAI